MESQRDEIIHQNAMEKEDMVTRAEREREELNDALNALQRDRDEQLLLAENDKQQALSLMEQVRGFGRLGFNWILIELANSED